MESVGQYLKTQRKLRSIELADIAGETKIAQNWLEYMEADQWDKMPGKAFARNFTKSYAKAVGLNEQDVLLRFDYHAEEERAEAVEDKPETRSKKPTVIAIAVAATLIAVLLYLLV